MKTKLIVLVILINSLSYSQNVKIIKNEIQQSINKQKTNLIKTLFSKMVNNVCIKL